MTMLVILCVMLAVMAISFDVDPATSVKEIILKHIPDPAKAAEVTTAVIAAMPVTVGEPAAEVNDADSKKMPWLKSRLDRAKETGTKSVLDTLGVSSLDVAKDLIAKAKIANDQGKTAEQKVAELTAERDRYKADSERYATGTKTRLDALVSGLTPEQQTLIPALPDADKVTWLEKAIARNVFGKPSAGTGGTGGTGTDSNAGGEIKFDSIPETAPGVVVKDGNKFISRKWIASLTPVDYRKYEKDIDKALAAKRIVA